MEIEMGWKDGLVFAIGVGVMVLLGMVMGIVMSPAEPRLVGTGCEGASGPLYADEEDHFPECDSISRR